MSGQLSGFIYLFVFIFFHHYLQESIYPRLPQRNSKFKLNIEYKSTNEDHNKNMKRGVLSRSYKWTILIILHHTYIISLVTIVTEHCHNKSKADPLGLLYSGVSPIYLTKRSSQKNREYRRPKKQMEVVIKILKI